MSEAQAETPAAPVAQKGFLSRFIGVFIAPGEMFEDVRRKPTVLLPLLVIYLVMAAVFFLAFDGLMADLRGSGALGISQDSRAEAG